MTLKPESNGSSLAPPKPSPVGSGRTSPSHFLPDTSVKTIHPNLTVKLASSNFVKSVLVFTLSGLVHDCGTYSLLLLNTPDHQPLPKLSDAFVLTPFFVAQPFGLVAEALIKAEYRKWRSGVYPDWKEGQYPRRLAVAEGLIGLTLTWLWIGWSAGWFVEGLTKSGMWSRDPGKSVYPSLLGGVIWGRWSH